MTKRQTKPISYRTSPLGAFLRDLRDEKHLSQEELQAELRKAYSAYKPSRGYISKIERGEIERPNDAFIAALAGFADVDPDKLLALARRSPPDESGGSIDSSTSARTRVEKPFKIAFGHCLWAAPLVLYAREIEPMEFEFTSFCKLGDEESKPVWLRPGFDDKTAPYPQRIHCGTGPKTSSYAAPDIVAMLERKEIDVGFFPARANPVGDQELLRVASVVDSWTGCLLVCRASTKSDILKKEASAETDGGITSVQLAKALIEFVPDRETGQPKPRAVGVIACESNTVASMMLSEGIQQCVPQESHGTMVCDIFKECPNRDFESAAAFFQKESEYGQEKGEPRFIGVLTWDPHASWLTDDENARNNERDAKGPLVILPVRFPSGINGRSSHLSFDMFIRKDDALSTTPRCKLLRKRLFDLVLRLKVYAARLNAIDSSLRTQDFKSIETIARYFSLSSSVNGAQPGKHLGRLSERLQPTLHAIGRVPFTAHFQPDALQLMRFHPE